MLLIRDHAFLISPGFQNYKLNSPNKQKIAAITTSFFMFLALVISMKEAFDNKAISTKQKDKRRKYLEYLENGLVIGEKNKNSKNVSEMCLKFSHASNR